MCFLAMGSVYALHGAATQASHRLPHWHGLWSDEALECPTERSSRLGPTRQRQRQRELLWPVLHSPRWVRGDGEDHVCEPSHWAGF